MRVFFTGYFYLWRRLTKMVMGKFVFMAFFLINSMLMPSLLYPLVDSHRVSIQLSDVKKYKSTMHMGVNTSFFRSTEDYSDVRIWQAMHDAGIKTIRFPGGLGNWYNWKTGDIHTRNRRVFDFMRTGVNRTIPMLDIIEKAKAFNINLSFVVNITESNESLKELVLFWRKHGAPIRWVEMGNEYYTDIFTQEIGGLEGYVRESTRVANVLKENGYRGKIGINSAPEFILGDKNKRNYIEWNRKLMNANLSIFDAIIIHYYPVANTIDKLMKSVPENFSTLVAQFRSMFPEKEMWVTEWSIGRPAASPLFNTLGHAILDLEILSVFQKEGIDLAIYHVFTGRGWEIWGYKRGIRGMNAAVIRRVPYFALTQFNQADMQAKAYSQLNFKDFYGIVFWKVEGISIILWNTNKEYHSFTIEGRGKIFKFKDGKILWGNKMARNGSLLSEEDEVEILLPKKVSHLEMPPYSFGLFNFSYRDKIE